MITELTVPAKVCTRFLKTDPARIIEKNLKKNLIGSMLAGGLRTANAHFANMLLGFYLATGYENLGRKERAADVVAAILTRVEAGEIEAATGVDRFRLGKLYADHGA